MEDIEKYKDFLGEIVRVQIDRPLGSKHPTLGFIYELNYGFVPGTEAGDGHEIDAYVIGPDTPVHSFEGPCVAIIVRHDDNEHKLVVASGDIGQEMISNATRFVERHYETSLILYES